MSGTGRRFMPGRHPPAQESAARWTSPAVFSLAAWFQRLAAEEGGGQRSGSVRGPWRNPAVNQPGQICSPFRQVPAAAFNLAPERPTDGGPGETAGPSVLRAVEAFTAKKARREENRQAAATKGKRLSGAAGPAHFFRPDSGQKIFTCGHAAFTHLTHLSGARNILYFREIKALSR